MNIGSLNLALRAMPRSGLTTSPPVLISITPVLGALGGGTHVVAEVDDSGLVTSLTLGGVAVTGFAVDDATHVSGDSVAHAAGAVDVIASGPGGASNVLAGAFTYAFDPATLALTGWWRASFASSPWAGNASAGTSAGRDLSEATNPPAVGAALNGLTPADFDGTNDILSSAEDSDTFFDQNAQSVIALVYLDVAGVADFPSAPYQENTITGSDGAGDWGLSLSSASGVRFWRQLILGLAYNSVTAPISTGAWHLIECKYDGLILSLRVDSGTWQTTLNVLANTLAGTDQNVGFGLSLSAFFNGKVAELMFSDLALSDANMDNIKNYINARYALSL